MCLVNIKTRITFLFHTTSINQRPCAERCKFYNYLPLCNRVSFAVDRFTHPVGTVEITIIQLASNNFADFVLTFIRHCSDVSFMLLGIPLIRKLVQRPYCSLSSTKRPKKIIPFVAYMQVFPPAKQFVFRAPQF